jgi:hypothetical protein
MIAMGMKEGKIAVLFSKTAVMSESFSTSDLVVQNLAQEISDVKHRFEDWVQIHQDTVQCVVIHAAPRKPGSCHIPAIS